MPILPAGNAQPCESSASAPEHESAATAAGPRLLTGLLQGPGADWRLITFIERHNTPEAIEIVGSVFGDIWALQDQPSTFVHPTLGVVGGRITSTIPHRASGRTFVWWSSGGRL
jgi:hypothetical protein